MTALWVRPFLCETVAATIVCLIVYLCTETSLREEEGLAGSSVRILGTLIIPALGLAFVHAFFWHVSLALSAASAWFFWKKRKAEGGRAVNRSRGAALVMILCIGLLGVKAAVAIASPPYDGDSMTYHLPMSIAYDQHHTAIPAQVMFHPGNSELLEALGLGALGSVGGQTLSEAVVALALFFAAWGVAKRLGASDAVSAASAACVLAIPIVGDQLFTAQNDVLVATLLLTIVALWQRKPMLSAIAIGLVVGTKFTGLAEVAGLVAVLWPLRSPDLNWKHLGLAGAIASPWYVRNLLSTGNAMYLGAQTSGFASSIAAHIAVAGPLIFAMFRNYGGVLSVLGLVAIFFVPRSGSRSIAAYAPTIVLVTFVIWCLTPNTAETARGTLDQLRSGWSFRYFIFGASMLTVSSIVCIARWSERLALGLACVAVIGTSLREFHAYAQLDYESLSYTIPCVGLAVLLFAATRIAKKATAVALTSVCIVTFSATATIGATRIFERWDQRYEGLFGAGFAQSSVQHSERTATIGIPQEALAVIGPRFERYDVVDVSGLSDDAWWAAIIEENPQVILASNVPLPAGGISSKERFLQASGHYELIFNRQGVRIYSPRHKASSVRVQS